MNSTDKHQELVRSCKKRLKRDLKPKRFIHTENVVKEALRLADVYGADRDKTEIAALLHDIARNITLEDTNAYVKELGLDDHYIGNKNLAHSKIGAWMIQRDFGINDEDIINAVSYHTTGRAGMSLLEKIIFLADAIEPARNYPQVDIIRELAYKDIDEACAYSLNKTKKYVESRGEFLDSDTEKALDYFNREISKYE